MTTKSDYPVEKKLAIFRKILWFCFGGISIPLLGYCAMSYVAMMINSGSIVELIIITIFLVAAISVFGAVCLGIYHIIKNHLEKDDGPFL